MTKKLVGYTGWMSAVTLGMIFVFLIQILPLHPRAGRNVKDSETIVPSVQETVKEEPEKEKLTLEETIVLLDQEGDPAEISGINKAAFSVTFYGNSPKKELDSARATLSSMVLSSHISEDALGKFDVTYEVTPEEYQMILYCVDFETRSGSLQHKSLIAQVIMNRVQGERFAFTVAEVLMAPGQFDVMPGYESRGDWTPSDVTVQAVNSVLSGESPDYAQGALYFCNPYLVGEGNWFDESLEVVCEIEGHRFYKR